MREPEFLDEIGKISQKFKTDDEFKEFALTPEFVEYLKQEYKKYKKIPLLFEVIINKEETLWNIQPTKQGIAMDFRFYSELDPITEKDIQTEENAEKRRLLMMEYGITKYMKKIKVIDEHKGKNGRKGYGKLIEAEVDGGRFRFMEFVNGTNAPEALKGYLKNKKMISKDGFKLYYVPVQNSIANAREATAKSFDVPVEWLHEDGWEFDA